MARSVWSWLPRVPFQKMGRETGVLRLRTLEVTSSLLVRKGTFGSPDVTASSGFNMKIYFSLKYAHQLSLNGKDTGMTFHSE